MSPWLQRVTSRELLVDVAIAAGLTALSFLALALRRGAPIPVLLIVFGSIAFQIATVPVGEDLRSSGGPLVALYTIGERVERRWGIPLLVGILVVMAVMMMQHVGVPDGLQSLIQTEPFLTAGWYMGDLVRIRGLYTRALEERAG